MRNMTLYHAKNLTQSIYIKVQGTTMRRQNPLSSLGRNCVEKSAGKSQLLHCLFAAAIHPTKNAHHKPRTGLGASNRLEFLETR